MNKTFRCVGSHKKHLLSFVIHLSTYSTTASTEWISFIFDAGDFMKICQENQDLVNIRQKYWTPQTKTEVHFIVAGKMNMP